MRQWRRTARSQAALWRGIILTACLISCMPLKAHAQAGADKIAAWVNGEYISESEFYDRLQRVRAQDFIISINPLQMRSDSGGQLILNSLIVERLFLQWAAKTNQMPSDAEVNAEFEAMKRQPAMTQLLANKFVTEDSLRYEIKVQRARYNIATTAASLSPAEAEAFYKAHIANFTAPERWGISIIRVGKPESVTKVQADLKAGKPFADVAKASSEDERTKEKGGDLGMVPANDASLPMPLKEEIKKLKVGETTAPIKLELDPGMNRPKVPIWYFVHLNSKEAEKVRPFAEVKESVERTALLEKAGGFQVADKKITQFRAESDIKINLPGYQNLGSAPKKP